MTDAWKALLRSRKFWLALVALAQTLALNYFNVPQDIWLTIDGILAVLITTIAWEDVAAKKAGNGFPE